MDVFKHASVQEGTCSRTDAFNMTERENNTNVVFKRVSFILHELAILM